jgi:hypothetical protein
MLEQDVRIDEDHSALAACQGHDFIRADAVAGVAVESSEPVRPRLLLDLHQDTAVLAALKSMTLPDRSQGLTHVGHTLGSETGYMLGSSAAPHAAKDIRTVIRLVPATAGPMLTVGKSIAPSVAIDSRLRGNDPLSLRGGRMICLVVGFVGR